MGTGTPNNGSPFGRVEDARKILNILTGLAMNFIPALVPSSVPTRKNVACHHLNYFASDAGQQALIGAEWSR